MCLRLIESTKSGDSGYDPESTKSGDSGHDPESTKSGDSGYDPESTKSGDSGYDPESTKSGDSGYDSVSERLKFLFESAPDAGERCRSSAGRHLHRGQPATQLAVHADKYRAGQRS